MPNLLDLPVEIVCEILEYLKPLPAPDTTRQHPFLALSRVSRDMNILLMSFLQLQITKSKLKALERYKEAIASSPESCSRLAPRLLTIWLNATIKYCIGCGRISKRRAIMDKSVVCCAGCDKNLWKDKITMSDAMKRFKLKKEDLFGGVIPFVLGGPQEVEITADGIIPQRKGLLYGQYMQSSTLTTMFMEEDVRELAAKKYEIELEDLNQYILENVVDKGILGRAIRSANQAKMKDYLRRLTHANGLDPTVYTKRIEYRPKDRSKSAPIILVREDMLLKKLGILFLDPPPGTPESCTFPTQITDARCHQYIQWLRRNAFQRYNSWPDCRFQRQIYVVHSSNNEYHYYDRLAAMNGRMHRFTVNDRLGENTTQGAHGSSSDSPQRIVHPKTLSPNEIQQVPIKAEVEGIFHTSDLEEMIYCRRGIKYSAFQYHIREDGYLSHRISEWADPVDYCLFLSFLEEFAVEGVSPPTIRYAQLRDVWRQVDGPECDVQDSREADAFDAPWSWTKYPLYVMDVTVDNYTNLPPITFTRNVKVDSEVAAGIVDPQVQQNWDEQGRRDERKIATKNAKSQRDVDQMVEAIKMVVGKCGWNLLGDRDAWDDAIQEALNPAKKANTKSKKGKEVEKQ